MRTLEGHAKRVFILAYLKQDQIASGSDDKTIKIWNLDEKKPHKTLLGHSLGVTALKRIDNECLSYHR